MHGAKMAASNVSVALDVDIKMGVMLQIRLQRAEIEENFILRTIMIRPDDTHTHRYRPKNGNSC